MIDPARRNQVIRVTWLDGGRQAQPPPNPTYPRGIDVDCSDGAELTCTQALAAAPALICGVHRNRDVAKFGQALRIEAGDLLFTPPFGCATTTAGYFRLGS
jgi:hypothetical protein